MRELRKYLVEKRESIKPSSNISAAASPAGDISQGQDKASVQRSADSEPKSGDQQPLHETCGIDHETSGVTTAGPTPGPMPGPIVGPIPGPNPVVTTEALDIDPPPGLPSGVSYPAHPGTTEQPPMLLSYVGQDTASGRNFELRLQANDKGVSHPAHPETTDQPPGPSAGVSRHAHPAIPEPPPHPGRRTSARAEPPPCTLRGASCDNELPHLPVGRASLTRARYRLSLQLSSMSWETSSYCGGRRPQRSKCRPRWGSCRPGGSSRIRGRWQKPEDIKSVVPES